MTCTVAAPVNPVKATVILPASKSISNRALIIRALSGEAFPIENLSTAADTQKLIELLSSVSGEYNCGEGGTTLRFTTAYLAVRGGDVVITAAPSLRARPFSELASALTALGASITYLEQDGRLPVRMVSSGLVSNSEIEVPGNVSSQFISALMLIGPYIKNGITIRITGETLSLPYIMMTANVMKVFGVTPKTEGAVIAIPQGKYSAARYTVEPDWSAASYWFEIAALSKGSNITLSGLSLHSIQGDAAVAKMMSHLGVTTIENHEGLVLSSGAETNYPDKITEDHTGCPDVAPAMICASAGLNRTADFPGLKNFRLKESDRAAVFQRELYNFNVHTDFCGGSKFKVYAGAGIRPSSRIIKTYHDHRVAMALAPLSLVAGPVIIENPEVVSKSYPHYYDDLVKAGFKVTFEK
ncbi:MAG TPA: 3-phosphoshikimate 1-carboxyvinyltransferase [Bacteroidia bacterium]|nr:3-phosphoshikimate 1-carboxyvinyltransferase [Bacteroidia bacterium]